MKLLREERLLVFYMVETKPRRLAMAGKRLGEGVM